MGRLAENAIRASLLLALCVFACLLGMLVQVKDLDAGKEDSRVPTPSEEAKEQARRERMVLTQIEARGVTDQAVLAAMRAVPRHRFVPSTVRDHAYSDGPLPIGDGQTISQPYVVAIMSASIHPQRKMRVLEIGTGSGYQAAVLANCVGEVYTIETIPELGCKAETLLKELRYRNVHVRIGDGFDGWPEHAPFDAIVVTAAAGRVPQPLMDQLRVGGRLVAPIGAGIQDLVVIMKTERGSVKEVVAPVRFVPMTGKAEKQR